MSKSLPDLEPSLVLSSVRTALAVEEWPNRKPDWRGDLLEWTRAEYWVWVDFFQRNGLTTRTLADGEEDIGADFQIMVGDLTDEGLEMYGVVEERWYAALGRRDANAQRNFIEEKNTKILESNLKRIRKPDYDLPKRVVGRK